MTPDYTCGCTIFSRRPEKEKSQQNTDTQHLASSTGTILTSFSLNVVRCPIDDVVLIDLLLLGHVRMLGWTFRRIVVAKFNDGQKLGKSFLGSLCALWGLELSERAFKVKLGSICGSKSESWKLTLI